jgi:TM2 domain-containing membrane protein YozV
MSDSFKDLENSAKKAGQKIKETAKDLAEDLNENTKEFQEEAKETAQEFKKGAQDAYEQLVSEPSNKKILAGILAILFGSLGIHKFILGYTKEGLIMLAVTLISFGFLGWLVWAVSIIEGIIYLSKTDEDFYQTYQVNKKSWF